MQRQGQSKIILLIMGTAIVLAAVLTLAVSNIRNRPESATAGEQIIVAGQPIILRENPNMAVQVVIPEPPPPPTTDPNAQQPTPLPPTPTDTPVPAVVEEAPTLTPTPVTVVVQSTNSVILRSYTVVQGDTMYKLTQNYATSIALLAEHGISQESLVPGTTIQIPVGNPDFCTGGTIPYAVGEGETVFGISQKRNTTKEEIQRLNNLNAAFAIEAAQILCVP